jgi:hypothetical protein
MQHNKPSDPTRRVVASPDAGQTASSRNAMKHGCCAADTLLLPTESMEDFKALEATWCKAYNPQSEAERHLLAELIQADWFLQRATRAYSQVEAELYAASPNPIDWTEQQERKLGRHLRYKTAHTNLVNKCRKAIEDYRKARLSEKASAEKSELAQERLKALKQKREQKNRPEPTWKEHLEGMRQKAIALGYTPPDPTRL